MTATSTRCSICRWRGGNARACISSDLIDDDIKGNPIRVAGHCYGCTAGQGSSCGGALEQAAE